MHVLSIIGLVLAGGIIGVDHLIRRIPHGVAVVLYTLAVVLMVAGMLFARRGNI